jgi:hypothetical protein
MPEPLRLADLPNGAELLRLPAAQQIDLLHRVCIMYYFHPVLFAWLRQAA